MTTPNLCMPMAPRHEPAPMRDWTAECSTCRAPVVQHERPATIRADGSRSIHRWWVCTADPEHLPYSVTTVYYDNMAPEATPC